MVREGPFLITIGPVNLTVADLSRSRAFYTERLGLRVHGEGAGTARFGVGGADLLVLDESPSARRTRWSTGLFHFALLLPSREALAHSLTHLLETRTPLDGAADHLVSEALYLSDPEGNGIELYRDRPREGWVWDDGAVRMTTDPLDVNALADEGRVRGVAWQGLPEGTTLGHVHLRVADIVSAERFYCDVLGLELTARYGTMASFVSAGGYHHHVAFNTWGGIGAPPAPMGAAGLREFVMRFPDSQTVERVLARARAAGAPVEPDGVVRDPSGIAVRLGSPESASN